MSETAENGCSEDQAYSGRSGSVDSAGGACSCARRFGRRTASSTATGAWWRTGAWPAGAWCSGTLLYLGEINSSQELAWRKSIEVLDEGAAQPRTLSLFPEDRCDGILPTTARSCG